MVIQQWLRILNKEVAKDTCVHALEIINMIYEMLQKQSVMDKYQSLHDHQQ